MTKDQEFDWNKREEHSLQELISQIIKELHEKHNAGILRYNDFMYAHRAVAFLINEYETKAKKIPLL